MKTQRKNVWTLRKLLMCCFALMILTSCSQSVQIQEEQSDTELFEHASTLYAQGDYKTALEYFLYVKENFLRSNYAGLTRFYAGQCYFELEKYDEAIIEYKSFLSFFPGDPNAPEAQFKLGVSLFELALGPERDQTTIQESLSELQKVAEKYPDNEEYMQKTEEFLKKVKDRIASYEYRVAQFYRKEKRYSASNSRLLFLMKQYPETSLYDDALFMLAQNYMELDQPEEAKEALAELLRDYPDYEESDQARKKLRSLGVANIPEPTERPVKEDELRQEVPQEEPIVELSKPQAESQQAEIRFSDEAFQHIPEGYVVLLRDEQVFVNLIREDGIQEGMFLEVLRGEQPVGTLRVVEVQEGFSIGEIESIEQGMTIREDDRVRVAVQ